MRLMHFSHKPIESLHRRESIGRREYHKPVGFWVSEESNGDGWRDWCTSEDFGPGELAYDVELRPDANIRLVDTIEKLDALTDEFGIQDNYMPSRYISKMDWPRFVALYDGILIVPYFWERRLADHSSWYYSRDCASGCIWNPDAVASIVPARLPLPELRREAAE